MQRLLSNQGRCSLSSAVMKEWLEKNDSDYIIAERCLRFFLCALEKASSQKVKGISIELY